MKRLLEREGLPAEIKQQKMEEFRDMKKQLVN
jgi:hypothetical protein